MFRESEMTKKTPIMIDQSVPFFIISAPWSEKGVNYHQEDDSSGPFTSVKMTISLRNIFTFKESEKSLKMTLLGYLFHEKGFNEPEKEENFDLEIQYQV